MIHCVSPLQSSEMRQHYMSLKRVNEHLLKQLENSQQELDQLGMKKAALEEELASSPVKQEAGTHPESTLVEAVCTQNPSVHLRSSLSVITKYVPGE